MTRYSKGAIILHWLMALMIIGNLAGGFLHDFVPREGGQRALVMDFHKSFGLTIIALTLFRLGWRLGHSVPALPAYFTGGERLLAKAAHWGFYAVMLALPLLVLLIAAPLWLHWWEPRLFLAINQACASVPATAPPWPWCCTT